MGHWWNEIQWRMIQTNLREIDMEKINAAEYVKQLKEFDANVVTLNAAGIIASYETELECQTKSDYLHGDSLKDLVEACHKEGIHVICRTDFSKVRYALYKKHPEWAYHTESGEIMNYNGDVQTCPNGEYQKKYMFDILQEVLTKIPFDGVFLNMSGFMVVDYSGKYYGPCHCENCQKEFQKIYGMELPDKDDPRDPAYLRYMGFKAKVMKEQKDSLYAFIKRINPEIAVNGFDYLRTESNTEIGREQWAYSASMNSRLSSGWDRKIPSDNASVDFMGFRYRDISVSPELLQLRQWQNLANSNCLSFYLMGMPGNHDDVSGFDPTKKVFHFAKEHEDIYSGLKSAAEVLVLHSGMPQRNDHEAEGMIRALTESHIPFDEASIKSVDTLQSLAHWKIVILPNVPMMNDLQLRTLDAYVNEGGTLIATGDTASYSSDFRPSDRPMLNCLGIHRTVEKKKDAMSTIFRLKKDEKEIFPYCMEETYIAAGSEVTIYEYADGVVQYMELVPEHPFGPPERCYFSEVQDHPSVSVNNYGKGKGISVPWLPGSFYRTEGYANTQNFLKDLFLQIAGAKSVAEKLTSMVEVTVTKKEGMTVIQLINNTGMFMNSYVSPVPVREIELVIPGCRGTVMTLCGGHVEPSIIDHECVIRLDELKEYEAIVIKEEK